MRILSRLLLCCMLLMPVVSLAQTRDTTIYACNDSVVIGERVYRQSNPNANITINGVRYHANIYILWTGSEGGTATACNSYVYRRSGRPDSIIYNSGFVWYDTLRSVVMPQCDSIVKTTTLKIYPAPVYHTYATACDVYRWHDVQGGVEIGGYNEYYAEDGEIQTPTYARTHYPDLSDPEVYCTVADTLHLIIHPSFHDTVQQDACDSYYWDRTDNTYYYTNIYSRNYKSESVWGCDSIYALDLRIHPSYPHPDENITDCDSYTWPRNNTTYTQSSSVDLPLQSVWGCDSNYHLNLTLGKTTYRTIDTTVCNSFYWNITRQTYTTSIHRVDTIRNHSGCDSIVTLNLTVKHIGQGPTTYQTACGSYTWSETGETYSSSGTYVHTIPTGDVCDSTVYLQLTINPVYDFSENVTNCDGYTWPANGQRYTTSTNTSVTLTSVSGCDSIRRLNLTIKYSTTASIQNQNVCDSYLWATNGRTYTQTGIYYDTLKNMNTAGCDSAVSLNLTVRYSTSGADTVERCNEYVWKGVRYTQSGSYTEVFENAVGCDSTVGLILTIHYSDTTNFTRRECDSLLWNGRIYRESCYTIDTFLTQYGCDSLVRLNLTVPYSTVAPLVDTSVCDRFYWTANERSYTSSCYELDTVQNVAGCDSAVSLNLTVRYSTSGADTVERCNEYVWNGVSYTVSGSYTDTLVNAVQCDSVVGLILTIHYSDTTNFTRRECDSLLWNGRMYYESGYYIDTFPTIHECDSLVRLILTVPYSTVAPVVDTSVCDQFHWMLPPPHDHSYTISGLYLDTIQNSVGCDSAVSLNLTVRYSTAGIDTQSVCDQYVWNGVSYTVSGDYTDTLVNAVECDSVVGLNLTVRYSCRTTVVDTACDVYYWHPGEPPYTIPGVHTYIDTLTNVDGCDSIRTLHLALGESTNDTTPVSTCDHYTWAQTWVEYMYSGIYVDSLVSMYHCDSILTLDLTVRYSSSSDTVAWACDSLSWYGTTYYDDGRTPITGHFSTSHIDLVYFAPGNLQYNAVENAWRFASAQYERIGANNSNISEWYSGWIDLFSWGTSGWNSGAEAYMPYSNSMVDDDYYPGGDYRYDLRDTFANADWGIYNSISQHAPGWGRTLSANEWLFMLYERSNADNLRAPATVNGVTGLLLLPDNWQLPAGISINHRAFSYTVNTYNLNQWEQLEQAGAVFLPTGGMRLGRRIYDVGQQGYYWTSTHGDSERSGYVSFVASGIISGTATDYRSDGLSVRLAHDTIGATAIHTFIQGNAQGCDSVVRLHLSITHAIMGDTTQAESCDSFTWTQTSHQYDTTGFYFDTLTAADGCDSVVTLDLTVNYSQLTETVDTACDSYLWNDSTFTQSGRYGMLFSTIHQCDSLDSLYLTVHYSSSDTLQMNTCDYFDWNDSIYRISGEYYRLLTNAVGCDSNDYLHLTLRYSTTDSIDTTTCDRFYWSLSDSIYTLSGLYFDSLPNAAGCDSVVSLSLHLFYSDTALIVKEVCDSMMWNDSVYRVSGFYERLLSTFMGCDSLDRLDLTVHYSNSDTLVVDQCDSFVWNGRRYTQSGLFDTIFPNIDQCDSTDVLSLTLRYSTFDSSSVAVCDEYVWPVNNVRYMEGGRYVDTLPNTVGCDSVVSLNLTISHASSHDTSISVCDSYFWNGRTYDSTGVYTRLLTNEAGCDSSDRLILTVSKGFHDTTFVEDCNYYDWREARYYSPGIYAAVFPNAVGCDSAYYLVLHLKYSVFDTLPEQTVCDSYYWDLTHERYTVSDLYTYASPRAEGCDSVVVLPLTVHYSQNVFDTVAKCYDYIWPVTGEHFERDTNVVAHFQGATGCDSVRHLNLHILHGSTSSLNATICEGDGYVFDNRLLTQQGTYHDTLPNVSGCDSIVSLNLMVRPLFDSHWDYTVSCGLQQVTLEADDIAPYLHWSAQPDDPSLVGHESEPLVTVSPRSSTVYTLVTDYSPDSVCPTSFSQIVHPVRAVSVDIIPSTTAFTPTDREITIVSNATGASHYQWYVDSIAYSDAPNIFYTAAVTSDSVTFMLVAYNDYCSDTAIYGIRTLDGKLFVPNIFTPNLETNSTFFVQGIGIVEYHIYIYDRRGDKVYESDDMHDPWNGLYHNTGEQCVQANYVYTIRYRTVLYPESWHTETGSVMLLR